MIPPVTAESAGLVTRRSCGPSYGTQLCSTEMGTVPIFYLASPMRSKFESQVILGKSYRNAMLLPPSTGTTDLLVNGTLGSRSRPVIPVCHLQPGLPPTFRRCFLSFCSICSKPPWNLCGPAMLKRPPWARRRSRPDKDERRWRKSESRSRIVLCSKLQGTANRCCNATRSWGSWYFATHPPVEP